MIIIETDGRNVVSNGYSCSYRFWDIQSNMGDFKIWGHEITITSRNLVNEFKWTTNLNVSFNRNKILKLGTENAPIGGYETYGDLID